MKVLTIVEIKLGSELEGCHIIVASNAEKELVFAVLIECFVEQPVEVSAGLWRPIDNEIVLPPADQSGMESGSWRWEQETSKDILPTVSHSMPFVEGTGNAIIVCEVLWKC